MRPSLASGFTPRSESHLVVVTAQEGRGEAERWWLSIAPRAGGVRWSTRTNTSTILPPRYLEFCLDQIVKDNEVGALVTGLEGRYVEPGPGGDPIRNPLVLPTGKNIHALDPQSIPTQVRRSVHVRVWV